MVTRIGPLAPYDVEVLVIGAGPTGLVMASELTRHGVSCRIIDKAPQASEQSKALLVQYRSLEVLGLYRIIHCKSSTRYRNKFNFQKIFF